MPGELELHDSEGAEDPEQPKRVRKSGSNRRPKKLEKGAKVKTDKRTGEQYVEGPRIPAAAPQEVELETRKGETVSVSGNTIDIPCNVCRQYLKITGHTDTLLRKKCPKCGCENKVLLRRTGNAIELQHVAGDDVQLCPKGCCFHMDTSRGFCAIQ